MADPAQSAHAEDRYTGGSYLETHPDWHVEDSAWKAEQVEAMLVRHGLTPHSICEVGCGAGEVLRALRERLDAATTFVGYEISPQAHELASTRTGDRLRFVLGDLAAEPDDVVFDLLLVLDVIEHLEDPFAFLRAMRPRAGRALLHIPLDLTVQAIARNLLISSAREPLGHLQYFQKETALATLVESGYEIVDWVYTPSTFVHPPANPRARAIQALRRAMFSASPDVTQRLIGGWSLLVLAR
ncbi:MAG TPA: methyltransferase domain-containing protein [Solirubrobacteraceae bacterium]|nr:methyltransferase domain-containing protein [Solirubrobacteraceae bacterium]